MSGRRLACGPCRKARIGCDASLRKGSPCSNCVRRGKCCLVQNSQLTTEHGRQNQSALVQDLLSSRTTTTTGLTTSNDDTFDSTVAHVASESMLSPTQSTIGLEQRTCRRQQAFSLHQLLWDIFMQIYEARFCMFIGESCCPYVEMTATSKAFISRLSIQLDGSFDLQAASEKQRTDDKLTNDALLHAVYAYAARWLPLLGSSSQGVDHSNLGQTTWRDNEVAGYLWRRARPKIQAIMSRPSYRALHALQMFGAAERPLNCDDPGFSDLCGQVQMSHIVQLRSPSRSSCSWRLSPYTTFPTPEQAARSPSSLPQKTGTAQTREHLADVVFWLCVMKDSYSSLVRRSTPTLLPHASGDKRLWDFIRQRTVIFNNAFQTLHGSVHALPNEVVTIVLQHASACKVMYLNVINRYYNVVHFQDVADTPEEAAQKIITECDRFHHVFDPLLEILVRDFLVLDQRDQLNYVWLLTHYHLGSLTLANILDETPNVPACLKNPHLSRLYVCKSVVNTLGLGLLADRHSPIASPYKSRFLLEPVPEIQVEALSLTCSAILLLYQTKELSSTGAKAMLSVVITVLRILSQISQTASFVLTSLHDMAVKAGLELADDPLSITLPTQGNIEATSLLSLCDRDFIDEFSQEMKVQVHADSSMVDRMIQKYEDQTHHHLERRICTDLQEDIDCFIPNGVVPPVFRPSAPSFSSDMSDSMEGAYVTPDGSDSLLNL